MAEDNAYEKVLRVLIMHLTVRHYIGLATLMELYYLVVGSLQFHSCYASVMLEV